MYQGGNRYTHNFVSKGIWRMGTVPPVNIEYESSLKDYPYGLKIIPGKIDPFSDENNAKREKWNELCSKCHGPRFVEAYRETLDDWMLQAWEMHDKAQKVVDDVVAEGLLYPSVADRGAFPMGEVIADLLGPELLGEPVFKAFKQTSGKVPIIGPILGVYSLFFSSNNNPHPIEKSLSKMWFFQKTSGYKGVAHAQQDYAWWWGSAPMLHEYTDIQAQAASLRRDAEIERRLAAIEARLK
jgi:hydroxylamine dehydrogenase